MYRASYLCGWHEYEQSSVCFTFSVYHKDPSEVRAGQRGTATYVTVSRRLFAPSRRVSPSVRASPVRYFCGRQLESKVDAGTVAGPRKARRPQKAISGAGPARHVTLLRKLAGPGWLWGHCRRPHLHVFSPRPSALEPVYLSSTAISS